MNRETISRWNSAVVSYDEGHFDEALAIFAQVAEPTAKILFDIGCIHLTTGSPNRALEVFARTIEKDPHLSVAHFQNGVAAIKVNRVSHALDSFQKAYFYMRGNTVIDYRQLGLPMLLYASQVLLNVAVCLCHLNKRSDASKRLQDALSFSSTEAIRTAISEAIERNKTGRDFPLQELPPSAIFRPSKAMVANLGKRDYLGKAQVVAALDENDTFTGFLGAKNHSSGANSNPSSPKAPHMKNAHSMGNLTTTTQPDLSAQLSPCLGRSRPPPPNCPPPRFPNRKIVLVQKSQSTESLHSDDLSSVPALKSSHNLKTGEPPRCAPLSSSSELVAKYVKGFNRGEKTAPCRPHPFIRTEVHEKSNFAGARKANVRPFSTGLTGTDNVHNHIHECTAIGKGSHVRRVGQSIFYNSQQLPPRPPPQPPPIKVATCEDDHLEKLTNVNHRNKTVVAVTEYDAVASDQLSFKGGEMITVIKELDEVWFEGRVRDRTGMVPWSCVESLVRKSVFF